jgi:hypothetical protein
VRAKTAHVLFALLNQVLVGCEGVERYAVVLLLGGEGCGAEALVRCCCVAVVGMVVRVSLLVVVCLVW